MSKKVLLMMLLMALFAPWAANAQETLTVCDGTTTNGKIPVNGLYVDTQGTTSEFIIPATTEGMSDMTCGTISKLTFYVPTPPATWGTPTIQLYMGEVDYTTLSSLNGPTNFTVVATGVWDNTQSTIEIVFDAPYTYNGGNLLIGTYVQTKSSTYKTTNFAGVSATSGSSRYNNGSGSGTAVAFLPKTTFTYTPSPYAAPSSISYTNNEPGNTTVSWGEPNTTATVTGYAYRYKLTSETEWPAFETVNATTTSVTLASLEFAEEYEFEVKALYGENESCATKSVTFTTLEACMTPENLTISDVTAHAATLTWTEGFGDGEWVLQYKLSTEEEYTSVDVALADLPYTFTGLTAESTYNVQIAPVCDATKTLTGNFTTTVACFAPTNLAVEANVQTATFTWESDVNDYEIAHASVATADPIDNIVGTATDTVYSMSNLTIDTDHYFWVRSNCGSEGYSAWAGPVSVHIGYCVPNPSSHDGKGITGVSFGTGDYVVTNGDGSASLPASAPYYGDYSSMIGAVQAGVESTIAITTGTNSYPYTFVIWVDFDNSLSFEDSEIVYVGKASSGNGTLNAAITIPATQELGDYRMRIYGADSYFTSFYNNGNPDYTKPHDPCSSGSYRHAHDYTLRVLEAPSCLAPTGLTVSDVTAHNATISWTSDAEAWEIQLDEEEAIEVTETTYTFTGLTAETTYSVKVRTNCGGTYSDWTNPVSFTTTIACPVPTVAVGSITAFTAEVSCTNTAAEYFNVMLGEEVVAENVAMPYTLTELTDNTSYTVKVQAICGGEDGESEWSSGTSFMTAEICPEGMVCIGAGTNTSVYVPAYNYYKYSYSQQIYTADEIGMAGEITSIEFKNTGAEKTLTCNVYMTATDKTAFANTSDWVALSDGDLVFSGSITFTAAGEWTTIEFENPFNYDGTSNLLVTVANVTGSYSNQPHMSCLTFPATNQALYVYTDNGAYNIAAPGVSGTRPAFKNRIRMAIGEPPACPKPTGLAVNYTGGTTATVTWEGEASSYDIEVNASGTVIAEVTSPYTLEGLELGTTYAVMVRANCGEDQSDWTSPVSFTTDLCMPENQCEITFTLTDSYGDGWNGAYIEVLDVATGASLGQMSNQNIAKAEETETYNLTVCDGREIQFVWHSGSYDSECSYVVSGINGEIFSGSGTMSEPVNHTVNCSLDPCAVPASLAASEIGTFHANLSWTGNNDAYNLQYRHPVSDDPTAPATIILTAGDIWGDGSGYQMLLDADATAYGTIIPEIGGVGYISTDGVIGSGNIGDVASSVYDEFEYKIPVNADGALATENIVINDTITIEIPAGTYDWCITNPTSGDRMWIASSNGNVGGRYDDFVFEAGLTYEFTVSSYGSGDGVNLAITPVSDWTLVEDITNPYELTGLTPHTMYEWQVQGISTECEGGVTEWSASSTFITDKRYYWDEEATWGGEIPGEYNDVTTPDNIDVIIRANTIVEAGCVFIGNGGSLTMEPGAQFYHSNDVPVSVQLDIEGYENGSKGDGGYYLISAPVYTNDIDSTILVGNTHLNTGAFDLYAFDQNYSGEEWRNFKAGAFNALKLGQGYLYANEDNILALFAGNTVSTDTEISKVLVYNDSVPFAGWNLVGNPFTCQATVDRAYYTMNSNGDEIVPSTNGEAIQPMEGIFVVAEGEGATVTFETAAPAKSASLNLNLSNGSNVIDRAIICFDESQTLPKFQLNPNHTKVFIPQEGKDYAVVSASEMGEMPVSFTAESNGTYTLSFSSVEVEFSYLHLIDNMTGDDVDLLQAPSYTFNARTTDNANRFKLVFTLGTTGISENFAFFSNGNYIINNEGKATLQVIDVNGRIISSETINGSASVQVKAAAGVYMIRLINGNDVKVQKVVVE